jgi:hypothetical protein
VGSKGQQGRRAPPPGGALGAAQGGRQHHRVEAPGRRVSGRVSAVCGMQGDARAVRPACDLHGSTRAVVLRQTHRPRRPSSKGDVRTAAVQVQEVDSSAREGLQERHSYNGCSRHLQCCGCLQAQQWSIRPCRNSSSWKHSTSIQHGLVGQLCRTRQICSVLHHCWCSSVALAVIHAWLAFKPALCCFSVSVTGSVALAVYRMFVRKCCLTHQWCCGAATHCCTHSGALALSQTRHRTAVTACFQCSLSWFI